MFDTWLLRLVAIGTLLVVAGGVALAVYVFHHRREHCFATPPKPASDEETQQLQAVAGA